LARTFTGSYAAPESPERDYPVFMTRNDIAGAALRLVEAREIVVRWDRHPGRGLYLYPKNFPTQGGRAIYDGGFRPCTAAEAKKLIGE